MTPTTIDQSRYLQFPRVGVRSGVSLGTMILTAVPEDPGPGVLSAAELLQASVQQLKLEWKSKVRGHSTEDVRPYDHRLDRVWAAVENSLDRYTVLDSDNAKHMRASEVHKRLFPTGLGFLQLPYIEQHAESEQRVEIIEEEGLREDLDQLVGKDFIDSLVAAHVAYGVALSITAEGEDVPAVSLAEPLRAVTDAISAYVLQVLAFAGLDPEGNTAAARRALRPIDVLRRAVARRSARRGEKVEIDDDVDDEAVAEEVMADGAGEEVDVGELDAARPAA